MRFVSSPIIPDRAAAAPILALLLAGGAAAQPAVPAQQPAQPPSIVELPIRLPLQRLFEWAEARMPLQAGNWRDWQDTHGIDTQYRAWRGPLHFNMRGEILRVEAHVRYWVKARKRVLGTLNLQSDCGVDEPPRQAIIGVMIHLRWGPDWTLRPAFRVTPTRFIDRCEMTIADIDVTPLIAKEFHSQLEDRMRAALSMLQPRLSALRQQAERSWFLLQRPVEVAADHWLLLNPRGIALSPLAGHGDRVDAHLAVLMAPDLVNGSEPASRSVPLPPLMRFYPRRAGLNLQMAVDLDYEDLGRAVNQRLSEQSIDIGGHRTGVEVVELGGEGREIRIDAKLTGEAAGKLTLTAEVVFVQEQQAFNLQDLAYSYTPEDPFLEPQARLLYGYIRKSLEAAANQQLQQHMAQWKNLLLAVFERVVPDDLALDLASLQLSRVRLDMQERGISLNGLANGHIVIAFR
jgi:hypothetical protein